MNLYYCSLILFTTKYMAYMAVMVLYFITLNECHCYLSYGYCLTLRTICVIKLRENVYMSSWPIHLWHLSETTVGAYKILFLQASNIFINHIVISLPLTKEIYCSSYWWLNPALIVYGFYNILFLRGYLYLKESPPYILMGPIRQETSKFLKNYRSLFKITYY